MRKTIKFIQVLKVRMKLLRDKEDFQTNPLMAVGKRLFFRLRWRVTQSPWTLWLENRYRIDVPSDCSPGAAIFYFGASEPKGLMLVRHLLKPGMIFLDVGAHLGEYSLVASTAVGRTGVVHAFEPGPTIGPFLIRNIEQNFASNVQIHRIALSDIDGQVEFNVANDPGHSRLETELQATDDLPSSGIVPVLSARLDTWIQEHNNLQVDFLKIDVEGVELSVLKGAKTTLSRSVSTAPKVLFEYHPSHWEVYGHSIGEAKRLLQTMGYTIYGIDFDNGLVPIDNEQQAANASLAFDLLLIALRPEHVDEVRIALEAVRPTNLQ